MQDVKFWTFTFKTPHTAKEGSRKWNHLATLLRREFPDCKMVRVYELHPSGHGLHVHGITPLWLPIRTILDFAKRAGFGRIHVVDWDSRQGLQAGQYIAKYLSKERCAILRGVRLYGFVGLGADEKTLQRDIVYSSALSEIWAILSHLPDWPTMRFSRRSSLANFVHSKWVSYQPGDYEEEGPESGQGRQALGRIESLYLVITGTIQQGREAVAQHQGFRPPISASLQIKLDQGEEERRKERLAEMYGWHKEPSLSDEIEQNYNNDPHDHEQREQRTSNDRESLTARGLCPF